MPQQLLHLLNCELLGLICSACASIVAWSSKSNNLLACQSAYSSLLPAPVAQPVPLAAAIAAAGVGGGRGGGPGGGRGGLSSLVTCSNTNNFYYTNPAHPARVKTNIYLCLPRSPRRAKNDIYAGYSRRGTVYNCSQNKCAEIGKVSKSLTLARIFESTLL